jgi:HAD superfamily hydrolase (TIGR01549 family)
LLKVNGRHVTGVIFDIDGTLVDSFSTLVTVFNQGTHHFNLKPVTFEFLTERFKKNLSLGEILREIAASPVDESVVEKCKKEILQRFLEVEAEEIKLFPGVPVLFQKLKDRGMKIGIATGRTSPPENEWTRFKRFGLDRFIDALVTSREVEKRKPAPDAILLCALRLSLPVQECLVVGDTEFDVLAAREAGAMAAAVSTGIDDVEFLKKSGPELLFKDIREFSSFVDDPLN